MKLNIRTVAGALVLSVALAGCTHPPGPQVATADRAPATVSASTVPSPSKTAVVTDYDKALNYTRCMTAHGAPTPDPVVGQLLVTVNLLHVGESEATIEAGRTAFDKCKQLLPATWPMKQDLTEAAAERPFRECVRKQGVAWPEPDANGNANFPTDPYAMATPAYNAAIQVCRHLLDDPANNLPGNQ